MGNHLLPVKLLRRFNGFVVLNIAGLALGLASVIFITIWVTHELSYDRFYKNSDRIYRVESMINLSGDPSVWQITPAPVASALKNDFPEVEDAVVMQAGFHGSVKSGDKLFTTNNLYFTDHSFFNIFRVPVISGDTSSLLTAPGEIVISKRIAEVLFGSDDPMGRQLLFSNREVLTVSGVIDDSPSNTHLKVDYLVPFSLLRKAGDDIESWGRIDFITYILLRNNADPAAFNKKLAGYWQNKIEGFTGTLFINPLTRLYLYRDPGLDKTKYPYNDKGPISRVILFSVIGLAIFIIACINFINLSTAFASQRAKEIGIRKVNGAGRGNLVLHLFGESVFQTSLAMITAIILVIVFLPVFVRISGINFTIPELFSAGNILNYLILSLFAGCIAGLYPALSLSFFTTMKVIKPAPQDMTQGSGLRKILVVIQFSLAFVFVFSILIIKTQLSFMQHAELGFDRESVMVIYPHSRQSSVDAIAEQVEKVPGVSKVALGGNVPVNMGNFSTFNKWDGNTDGKPLIFLMMQVDDRYLDLLDIRLTEGRQFYKGTINDEVIVNETAVRKMNIENPVGKSIWRDDRRYTIIGVVRDFYTHALREEIKPVFIYKSKDWWSMRIFVKLDPGNHFSVTDNIVDVIQKNEPGFPVKYAFLDEETNKYYDNERRLSTLVNAATILTIVISCSGLFSLTAFTIRKKRKEIGIRKAFGATIFSLVAKFQSEFIKLILISCMIGLPAGYYIIRLWLNSYASHIKLSLMFIPATVVIIVLFSSLTLLYHSLRAAATNPSETLRNE
ncbi:MAG TPA: ABC transporter permease [Bacteroidales bacterium]|nr:ABC transporter permease [Bacteroidales bacterium]